MINTSKKYFFIIAAFIILVLTSTLFFYERFFISYPDNIEVILSDGERLKLEQDKIDRLGMIEASSEQNVPEIEIFNLYLDLGRISLQLGHLADAEEAFKDANSIESDHIEVLEGIYQSRYNGGNFKGADRALTIVIKQDPSNWIHWRKKIELEQFHFNSAREELHIIYNEALKSTNFDINIITVYAQFLEEEIKLEEALTYWKMAYQKQPIPNIEREIVRLQNLISNK